MTDPGSQPTSAENGHPAADEVEMVRREQRLIVDTERVPTERVRIQRYIVTEQRTFTVDVRREEIRILHEAITPDADPSGLSAPREPVVVILHEEQVVITKTVAPVERVTLNVTDVIEQHEITDSIDREVIDFIPPGVL